MPGFYPMGIYHDDPDKVPAEACSSNIAITFKGDAVESRDIKIGKLPDMSVASLSHKGPGSEFKNTIRDCQNGSRTRDTRLLVRLSKCIQRNPRL